MVKVQLIRCDRCGKEFKEVNTNICIGKKSFIRNTTRLYLQQDRDLCDNCIKDLYSWFEVYK